MWLEAILSNEDVGRLLGDLLPLTIRLGKDGELRLDKPRDIKLVADEGIRATCDAHLHWSFLGIHVPVTIQSLEVMIEPSTQNLDESDTLFFNLKIIHADVAMLPTMIDNEVTRIINEEIAEKHLDLQWKFSETLTHVFALPRALEDVESIGLVVRWGSVKITREALVLAVSFKANVGRRGQSVTLEKASPSLPAPVAPAPIVHASRPSMSFLAGAMAVAAAVGFGVSQALAPRRGPFEKWLWG